jgi:alpha-aminoadipic semialdehyde synthase
MSVDILPSELPLDASQHFSKSILPYLRTLIREYESDAPAATSTSATTSSNTVSQAQEKQKQNRGDPELRQALNRATVAFDGRLTEKHLWLNDLLKVDQEASSSRKPASVSASGGSKAKGSAAAPQGKKKVLLLGSGLVSRPFVDQICTRSDVECVVGQCDLSSTNLKLIG